MGGIQYENLNLLSKQIWQWCEARNIWVFASYVKSADNVEADKESRRLAPETDRELATYAFRKILIKWALPQIDLFASRANTKRPIFISWQKDQDALAIDAFTLTWNTWFFYAFPPFSIILRVLQKICLEKTTGIVVVPLWPTQPWFPLFKSLLIDEPIIFEPNDSLLLSTNRIQHPLAKDLTLVAGKLSGKLLT